MARFPIRELINGLSVVQRETALALEYSEQFRNARRRTVCIDAVADLELTQHLRVPNECE